MPGVRKTRSHVRSVVFPLTQGRIALFFYAMTSPATNEDVVAPMGLFFVVWTADQRHYHIINLPSGKQAIAHSRQQAEVQLEIAQKMLKTGYDEIFITEVVQAVSQV